MSCGDCGRGWTLDEKEAERRLAVCRRCPNRKTIRVPLTRVDLEYCRLCKCPLATRVHATCPAEEPRW